MSCGVGAEFKLNSYVGRPLLKQEAVTSTGMLHEEGLQGEVHPKFQTGSHREIPTAPEGFHMVVTNCLMMEVCEGALVFICRM